MKPILFVDIDGVMADSIPWWLFLYNNHHQTAHRKEDVTTWDTRECIQADLSPYFSNYDLVEPVEDSIKSLMILTTKYRIVFATVGFGGAWLSRFVHDPEIVTLRDKSLLRGFALIDDHPSNLDVFIGERFLMDQPWNRGRGLNESNWKDITRYLMSI